MPDLRHACLRLLKHPGFTLVAVLTLALGIGANTAIFSLVQSVLLTPLPYPSPDRLIVLWEDEINFKEASIAWPDLLDWQRDNTAFTALGGYRRDNFTLTGREEPVMVRGARVSAALFDAVGLPPLRGRVFTAAEDQPGAAPLAVLGYGLWQSRFGGRDDVLGTTITLNGEPHTVIGVLPAEFATPTGVEFYTQIGRSGTNPNWQNRGNHPGIYAVGRMKPGVPFEAALADLRRISARISQDHPDQSTGVVASGQPLFEGAVGTYRSGLVLLQGAVGLVLLIACANLANLLLARGAARETEFAVRSALGASRAQLIRAQLAESFVLALAGGGLGVLLAAWAQQGIVALSPAGIARFQHAAIDGRVLAVSAALAIVTSLAFGLWPAWRAASPDLRHALSAGGRGGSAGPRAARAREGLIVAEVALTLVLLAGAGLLLRSFARMQAAQLGFDGRNVLTARVALPPKLYDTPEKRSQFQQRLLERLRALPGVSAADLATNAPLDSGWQTSFLPEGHAPWPNGQNPLAEMNVVSDGYFRTLGIPLLRGRPFGPEDLPKGQRVAIIDQAFADQYWPGQDPIGRRLTLGGDEPTMVIGVVPTLRVYGYANEPKLVQAYLSIRQGPQGGFQLLVRSDRDAATLASAVRRAVADVDPNQPIWNVRTYAEQIDNTFATPRLYTFLLTIFAGLAVVLAAVGLYGVLSYQVAQRTREFGIRLALGATRGQILGLVLGRGLRLFAAGAVLGLVGALALGQVLGSLLYQTAPLDPLILGTVTVGLAVITFAATLLPAQRAMRVDPVVSLRAE
ncbi:MAG: ABC transporter permease [Verrucomicrobia bacterium]|nr:ABC transporter permease [Verrucomicrobiota bacterium]